MDILLSVTDLRKSYRLGKTSVEILRGVDFEVGRGETVSVVGPSGSGKSTLFNLLGGLDDPTSGSIIFNHKQMSDFNDCDRVRHRQTGVGFVFQSFNLIPSLTALQNVELPLMLSGVPSSLRRMKAVDALEEVGLGHRMGHRPGELSGGEQQRVAIARAIVTGARMLLADEPTGNLDTVNGHRILDLIHRLNVERQITVILTTHDSAVARTASRTIELNDGRVQRETLNA